MGITERNLKLKTRCCVVCIRQPASREKGVLFPCVSRVGGGGGESNFFMSHRRYPFGAGRPFVFLALRQHGKVKYSRVRQDPRCTRRPARGCDGKEQDNGARERQREGEPGGKKRISEEVQRGGGGGDREETWAQINRFCRRERRLARTCLH